MPRLNEQTTDVGARPDPDEPQVRPAWVATGSGVPVTVDGVPVPGPCDDGVLGIEREQIAPPLPVTIPQRGPQRRSFQRAPYDPAHNCPPWWVDPDDRVRTRPHQLPHRGVVAVHHPTVRRDGGGDSGAELVGWQRLPAWLVIDRIQLHPGHAQLLSERPRDGGLTRTGVAHHRYPAHKQLSTIA